MGEGVSVEGPRPERTHAVCYQQALTHLVALPLNTHIHTQSNNLNSACLVAAADRA